MRQANVKLCTFGIFTLVTVALFCTPYLGRSLGNSSESLTQQLKEIEQKVQQPENSLPPHHRPVLVHDLFHFIITTSTLDWKMTRAVETVFYHHPDATVKLHSNTLQNYEDRVRVFQKAGYDLNV
eukprot:scaffold7821_cov107-Amphora_coffeaeformis.AAC.4